ncbi:hypothetical protein [Caproicibacterium sp. XB2]|uniref:hypothetical protein n=1 Tax=Caproicibacterium sp. XB2 TaxID=3388458 RepID=UPI0038505D5C
MRAQAGSLPTRERGLKSMRANQDIRKYASLPTRERGLKLWCNVLLVVSYRRSLHGSVD